ncbi:ATPase, partial [Mycobacterium nebraskense]
MSDHPTTDVGAADPPTTQLPPQGPSASPSPENADESPSDGGEAPTRAFAGFRTERRVPGPEQREAAPLTTARPAGMPPWDATPVTGIPRVDPTA